MCYIWPCRSVDLSFCLVEDGSIFLKPTVWFIVFPKPSADVFCSSILERGVRFVRSWHSYLQMQGATLHLWTITFSQNLVAREHRPPPFLKHDVHDSLHTGTHVYGFECITKTLSSIIFLWFEWQVSKWNNLPWHSWCKVNHNSQHFGVPNGFNFFILLQLNSLIG